MSSDNVTRILLVSSINQQVNSLHFSRIFSFWVFVTLSNTSLILILEDFDILAPQFFEQFSIHLTLHATSAIPMVISSICPLPIPSTISISKISLWPPYSSWSLLVPYSNNPLTPLRAIILSTVPLSPYVLSSFFTQFSFYYQWL